MAADEELQRLRAQNAELQRQLAEAKDTMRAIRSGEVDALIVQTREGERLFTLESAYEPYRVFVEHMQQGAAALTSEGLVLYANARLAEILGLGIDRIVGHSVFGLVDDRPLLETLLATSGVQPSDGETLIVTPDGRRVHALFHVAAMPDGTRCAVVTDVTERMRQRELLDSQAEANRAKDEFLATLSHELRTPVTAIMGWAHMLARGNLDAGARERGLQAILRNAEAQVQLVTDILDVSRIVSGKLRLEVRPVDLVAVVYAALDSIRPAADAKGISLTTSITATSTLLSGDADRLQQVAWNLLSNAVKFTPHGGTVNVTLQRIGQEFELRVSDTGMGIAPHFLPRMFDRFAQADSSAKRQHGGLGLGLSIVRHLVELHGGSIEAQSEGEGCGATFAVRLPIAAVAQTRAAHEVPEATIEPSPGIASLAGLRVLVVDDEEDTRQMLAALLAEYGAKVALAECATEGLQLLTSEAFDVLLADIAMPGQDGYEFIAEVRNLPRDSCRRIPAIALTAYGRPEDAERALASGFHLHLTKPVSPSQLAAHIERLVVTPNRPS